MFEQLGENQNLARQLANNEKYDEIQYEKAFGIKAFKYWNKFRHFKLYAEEICAVSIYFLVGTLFCKYQRFVISMVFIMTIFLNITTDMWMEHWSLLDAIFFITQTIFTIGYGDFSPTRNSTKIFTVIYLLVGLTVIFQIIQGVVIGEYVCFAY